MADPPQPADPFVPLLEESAEDLYEGAPCGYLSVLPDGTVARVNQTFLDWTGYRRTDVLGHRVQSFYTIGSRIFHETHLGPLLHMQSEVRGIAIEFRRADGSRLDTLVNVVVRRNPNTGSTALRMTVFDATDRRSYERELLNERRRAERNAAHIRVLQEMEAHCASIDRAEDIVAPIVAAGTEAFDATETAVWLLHPQESVLTVAGPDAPATAPATLDESGPEAHAVRLADVVVFESPGPDARAVTPLVADERVLGVVSFGFPAGRRIAADEVQLMRTIGRQAGQALERVRLHEETARRAWQSAYLARLSRALDEAVGSADRARRLVALLVPELGEYAQVSLVEGEQAEGTSSSVRSPTGGTGPADGVIAAGSGGPWPISAQVRAAVRSGGGAPVPLAGPDGRRGLALPLRARNAMIGMLLLAGEPAASSDRSEPDFLLDLADRVGLALDNARLAEQDREVARILQRSLLISERPTDSRFQVATVYRPAVETLEVGGDWYDTFTTSTGSVGVVVGDVVGRGIRAASAMGQLRSAVRAVAKTRCSPATVLRHMDDFVTTLEAGQMTTLAYAELALDTGVLRYACAGHPPPLLLPPHAAPRYLWDGRSGPLGTHTASRSRREAELSVPRGSRLLLYTDGLVERRGERIDQGLGRLAEALDARRTAPLGALAQQLSDAMLDGEGGHDDTCLLALAFEAAPRFHADVPAEVTRLSPLRARLHEWLAGCDVPEPEQYGIVLACSEAAANAIEHGYQSDPSGVVSVTATIDGDILDLRISDSGRWLAPQASADRGRGMALMGRLMDDLVVDRGEGTSVLMRRQFRRTTR
ncbi:SpoIIE family protein phosphatase [Micromonospora tarensis]|uniref:SpoIIE family protein phosphatase n=1 Tax=Micromonospora tarensis TaxID=2806100 RepID=A0ABS1YI51_9ACTN|nr:SpoIIE family protein phosphatase [Micromonospora tarensis]MBM0276988.1 SpoIIE family protein phosphatase [Micromonospora tarensis]